MKIQSLNLTDFRNFHSLSVNFSDQTNIFYGDNGSGKTNLLESLFVLCLGRSYRTATDSVLVNDDADVYRIEGMVTDNGKETELAVAFQRGGRKKITIDKVAIKVAELYDNFCAVAASPEDSEILAGSPSVRRTFLDIYLSQYSQRYLHTLTGYQKILAQKNSALKQNIDPGPYNELLIDNGSRIMKARIDFLDLISEQAINRYAEIADGSNFGITYHPSVTLKTGTDSIDDIQSRFAEELYNYRAKEEIMERSMIGPHRDDIYFEINGYPARTHGSQGEWRTAALALKLAVYHLIKEKREVTPILLLDEIFAELDNKRCRGLADSFADFEQLFLTTAVEPPDFLRQNSKSFKIVSGSIVEASE